MAVPQTALVLPEHVMLAPDVRSSLRLLGSIDAALTSTPLWLSRFIAGLAWVQPYLLGPSVPLARVHTERHAFGALRFYTPLAPAQPAAYLLYLHGGGFVLCGLDTHDALCRALAAATGMTIASLDYRLAPEHAVPAPQRDVLRAYQHLVAAAGPQARVAVGGDSAGGNLATSLCLSLALARDGREAPPFPCGARVAPLAELAATPQPALQLLIYPATDLASDAPSHARYARGWLLSARLREFFWGHYLGAPGPAREALKRHVLLSPLAAAGDARALRGQCPAVILTAQYDILHDEGVLYGEALQAAGVRVEHVEGWGLYHGFATATDLATGARAVAECAGRVKALLGGGDASAPR